MNRTRTSIDSPAPANNNSPRLADVVTLADRFARELAGLAGSPSQAVIVASIARAAITRAFGSDARS